MRKHEAGPARCAIIFVLLLLIASAPASPGIVEEIVATVNGEIITMTELEEEERELRAVIHASMSGSDLETALSEYKKTILTDMINQLLLYQRGERMGLDLNQVYRSYLDNFKKQNNIKDNDELLSLLKQQGMTVDDFRTFLLRRFVPQIMINIEVREKIAVTDAEAEEYYQQNTAQFSHPRSYTFREIAVLLRLHGEDEARAIGEKVKERLDAGEDFEKLVAEFSEAPSKDQGGLVEAVPGPEMAGAIRKALRTLEIGGVSEPVKTSLAVMVLKLERRTEAGQLPFEEVRPRIEAEIMSGRFEEELKDYLKKLWAESRICVMKKYRDLYPTDLYRGEDAEDGCSWG